MMMMMMMTMSATIEGLMFMNATLWLLVLIEIFTLSRVWHKLKRIERVLGIYTNQQPPDDGSI